MTINCNNSECTYCKSENSKFCYSTKSVFGDNFEIRQCLQCNAYFLSPNPTKIMLKQAYDTSYYGEQENKFGNGIIEKATDFFREKRAKRLNKYLKNGSNILDIGCGNGRFLMYVNKFGNHNIYGIEPEGGSAQRAKKVENLNLNTNFLQENYYTNNFFDAVCMFHVFEHLSNPNEVLDIVSKILKNNGILIMSFPNIASWQAFIFKGKWLHLDPPRHLFFFKPQHFIKLMQLKGYEVVKTRYFSIEQNPFGAIQSFLNLFNKKRELLFESLKKNKNYTLNSPKLLLIAQKIFFVLAFPFCIITDIIASLFKAGATIEITFIKNLKDYDVEC